MSTGVAARRALECRSLERSGREVPLLLRAAPELPGDAILHWGLKRWGMHLCVRPMLERRRRLRPATLELRREPGEGVKA